VLDASLQFDPMVGIIIVILGGRVVVAGKALDGFNVIPKSRGGCRSSDLKCP
jgi:hypothetical protein